MYKVTLSMPIYNVALYVERALLSALNQTFESIEFLIVDDKGSDNSMDIVRRIISEHPRGKDVRIIEHEKNIGLGATRNTAIDNANGEYLFFMDSDDEITPDCITTLYRSMIEKKVDFIAASYCHIDDNGYMYMKNEYPDMYVFGKEELARLHICNKIRFSITVWNKLYDINFLKDNNIRCVSWHLNEDVYFTTTLLSKTGSCRLISQRTLFYYSRNTSIVGTSKFNYTDFYAKQDCDIIDLVKKMICYCDNKKTFLVFYLISMIYTTSIKIINSKSICKLDKKKYIKNISFRYAYFNLLCTDLINIKYMYELFVILQPYCLLSLYAKRMDFYIKQAFEKILNR